jgi:hypothetical protein
MENLVTQFYELVKTSSSDNNEKLNSFVNDFDIESNMMDNDGSLDIDLKKLLDIK